MAKHTVLFQPAELKVEVETGATIAQAAALAGITIGLPCGGQGRCGRCTVIVKEGEVEQRSNQHFSAVEVENGYALACQDTIKGDVTIYVPPQKIERKLRTDKTAVQVEVPMGYDARREQPLRKLCVTVGRPSVEDQTDDWSRLKRDLAQQHGISGLTTELLTLRKVARALREGDWTVTLVVEMDQPESSDSSARLVDILPGDDQAPLWGAAIDIGTTSNHVWLVNLTSGEVKCQVADYNAQISRGEDVISRIIYAAKCKGEDKDGCLNELQGLVIGTLNGLLKQAAEKVGIQTTSIYKTTVAGNSTMMQLFAALQPESIRLAPFVTTINQLPVFRAAEIGLQICPSATVDCLPGVASYVGADIAAGVLSSGMTEGGEVSLFIDVGTNGEMVLGDGSWLLACACSAGPAFEGSGVVHGMRATEGAIEDVWISAETYEPTIRVIGQNDQLPKGICGSGLISLIAEMLQTGIVDKSGDIQIDLPTKRTREGTHGGEYVVAWGHESATGQDIVLTDVDIDNLMRAKAAVYAGFSVLAKSAGMELADVQKVLIGGAFGRHVNIEKAIVIGMLPDAPWDRFQYLGNTSARGAYLCLLSSEERRKIAEIANTMTYLELSVDNSFFEEFNAALFLPHTDESLFPSVVARDKIASAKD